ncbi:hypothetical protein VSDG_09416 [Cytospora chrysosperma]|uniref:Uncharacterized protein n=1 Tax=Cytospora chrysosperma TaxID=252740 RepID=A0A423VBU0_CYTCH|nr:hypothetical protein VSDG_09416 [Valsa sordida]
MPVLTSAASDPDVSHLGGHLYGHRAIASPFHIFLGALTAVVIVSLLLQRFGLTWHSRRHPQYDSRGSPWTGASASKSPHTFQSLPDNCWMRPGQGPGHFVKQASRAISRGEASGTAPVGLGGSVEGSSPGSMEEEETPTATGDWSRGVSTFLSLGATQDSSGLSYHGQVFPAAAAGEDGHDVGIPLSFRSPPPQGHGGGVSGSAVEKGKDNMDDDEFERHPGLGSVVTVSRSATPFFGQPEDIADGTLDSVPATGEGSSLRRSFELNLTRPPAPPALAGEDPVYLAYRTSFETPMLPEAYAKSVPASLGIAGAGITRPADGQGPEPDYNAAAIPPPPGTSGLTSMVSPLGGIPRQRSYSRGHSIRPMTAPTIQMPQEEDGLGQVIYTNRGAQPCPDYTFTPSSYPSATPLLPPPPPTMDDQFDLADIMFPGAGAVDGGVRVVPAGHVHHHDEGGITDAQGDLVDVFDDSAAGWKRHTRVYGGGVCLACAAAGGGGFYGARVRPEDKR